MTNETDIVKSATYIQELLAGETPDNARRISESMISSPHKAEDNLPPLLTREEMSQAQEVLINSYSV